MRPADVEAGVGLGRVADDEVALIADGDPEGEGEEHFNPGLISL